MSAPLDPRPAPPAAALGRPQGPAEASTAAPKPPPDQPSLHQDAAPGRDSDPTVQAWARRLILAAELEQKLRPAPDPGDEGAWAPQPEPEYLDAPGRPAGFRAEARGARTPRNLRDPAVRARLLHTFAHHELQAAELFARAILAFPETPRAFRAGLLRLALEELEHFEAYRRRLRQLGATYGDWPVRDWFWEHAPACRTPAAFTAFQGLGLEAGNLEHSARFAARLRGAGDVESAELLERIEAEEVGHVAFSKQWFERFTGRPLEFERYSAELPPPLTPALLRGRPLNRSARARAGLAPEFLDALEAEPDTTVRSTRR